MKTTASTKTSNTTSHNGENWPYHQYEGSKPELQGSYVPCATNPCSVHGGSEVYATSAEDALSKAHSNDSFGFTNIKTGEISESSKSEAKSDDKKDRIEQESEQESEFDYNKELLKSPSKNNKKTSKINGYKTIDAEKMAKEQGVYIDDSPLLHRLTDSEIKKICED